MNSVHPVALVTGGAVRVGRGIALALADAGWDLVLHYHSSASPADEVRKRVESLGRRCLTVAGNLADPETPEVLAEAARNEFGRLDLLVNSAANFRSTPIMDVEALEWDEVMDLNLRAPHLMVRACAMLLKASGGSVVNIADHVGLQPWVRYGHHSVSKAALVHLTRIQARALAPEARANAVAPGLVLPPEGLSGAALEREVAATALKRVGTPEDVAQAVLYLAGARFVTGQLLVVDGGGTLVDRALS